MSYDAYNAALQVYKEELQQFEQKRKKEIILDLAKMLELSGVPTEMISQKLSDDLEGYISDRYIRRILEDMYKDSRQSRPSAANAGENHTEQSCIAIDENDYQRIRPQVLARDNYKCTECGETKDLDIHHKKKTKGLGVDHDVGNLQTLCKKCHGKQTRSETADSPHRSHKVLVTADGNTERQSQETPQITPAHPAEKETDETLSDDSEDEASAATITGTTIQKLTPRLSEGDKDIKIAQQAQEIEQLQEALKQEGLFKDASKIPAEKSDEVFLSMDHWGTMFMIMRNGEKKGFWCKVRGNEIVNIEANYVRAKAQAKKEVNVKH